jgi:formylglycine-generating enzyme required for sulfatase activity
MDANFPKGFGSFYCMKYECSQQMYVDFLNSLTSSQQSARQPGAATNRNGISSTSGVYSTTTPFVPVSFIDVVDHMAFLDWAGLRPMSEMEFEKACRGTASAVTNEYAWGTTNLTAAGTVYTNGGTSTEVSTTSGANAAIRGGDSRTTSHGPIRCGAFATSSTTRETAGASFYGIMDLSGNLLEATVGASITYNGKVHGNGTLHAGGNADISAWPGFSSGTNSTLGSFLGRGGSWDGYYYANADLSRVADRQVNPASGYSSYLGRTFATFGIRGVRSESSLTTVETK